MSAKAEVIVVGGGVNGTSIAFHLAKAGMKDVVLIERWHLGAGATGKSGALVRMHYSNVPETQLAHKSLEYFENWKDMVGEGNSGFQQVGTLVFAGQDQKDHLNANLAIQAEVGVKSSLISHEEAKEIDKFVNVDSDDLVAYEPRSGYADPSATTFGFATAAEKLGVEILLETRVIEITHDGSKVTGVKTNNGEISAPIVIVAGGAWANELIDPLGIDLQMFPRLARIAIFRGPTDRAGNHPTYIDHRYNIWARPIDGNCTLGGAERGCPVKADPASFSEAVDQDYIDLAREHLSKRLPYVGKSTVRGNWAGILMGSADSRPLIGAISEYEGLYLMGGDSGTSFKTAPAIGKSLSELVLEGTSSTVDLHPFRPSRFAEGKPWKDESDYGKGLASISR